ncbi:DNA ligase [Shewanella colwelliana]|uniref:DNA ligase (NAD(+)) n=1 Tax=Shewanella colwelliana TaxID=23 RepID=A0ABQ4P0I2_SHECO|nr:BRCT domain-containing protein [Shewanella colwelliana]GIU41005.1 DNA ligase [Shewanella colwelliana]
MQALLNSPINTLSDEELSALLFHMNDTYRAGSPVVSDTAFDFIYMPALKNRIPNHPLVTKVQPEGHNAFSSTYRHKAPMLSTQKAYQPDEIKSFVERCQKAAIECGYTLPLTYRVSPKLDGIAAKYVASGHRIITRGDGVVGNCVSKLLEHGLVLVGEPANEKVGEIVIDKHYFEQHLSNEFSHPRNFVAGLANSDKLSEVGRKALKDGAVRLVFFDALVCPEVDATNLLENLDALCEFHDLNYMTDGTVIEVTNELVKQYMGHSDHHHHWQVAKKSVTETALVQITGIDWQVGRNKITPVLQLEPTWLSGATISKCTAHHAGNVQKLGLGTGAVIELTRSGEIIPKIHNLQKSVTPEIPTHCPCCSKPVQWQNDFIVCTNPNCSERQVSAIEYHFKLLEADLFGRQSVRKLVEAGIATIIDVYSVTMTQLIYAGFGEGQATNLLNELARVKATPVNDNKVLASLGIHGCGRGTSKRILKTIKLSDITTLTAEQLVAIDGFGELTSNSICQGITNHSENLAFLTTMLNVIDTMQPEITLSNNASAIRGLNIVFTGKMNQNRIDMSANAERLGANVQKSIAKTTDYLVIGENVGATKINAAKAKGTKIITEAEYEQMIG